MSELTPVLLIVASYVFGSLPFGLLIAKWWAGIDIREHGSGNIGATNVYRVAGKPAGIVVFVLDVLKGFLPPFVAIRLGLTAWWQVGAGLAAIVGHNASPFLRFKGGKGISTSLGVLIGISWKVGLGAWALWTALFGATGYVSVGSIAAAVSLAPFTLLLYPGDIPRLVFASVAGVYSIFKHRANIRRLMDGTESNFRRRHDAPSESEDAERSAEG